MTVREAMGQGYRVCDVKWQRGYISRKTEVMEQPMLTAGGNRKGELYFVKPSFSSTNYCLRVYLRKREG